MKKSDYTFTTNCKNQNPFGRFLFTVKSVFIAGQQQLEPYKCICPWSDGLRSREADLIHTNLRCGRTKKEVLKTHHIKSASYSRICLIHLQAMTNMWDKMTAVNILSKPKVRGSWRQCGIWGLLSVQHQRHCLDNHPHRMSAGTDLGCFALFPGIKVGHY